MSESTSGTDTTQLRDLLVHGGFWRWMLASQVLRLPPMMAPLAFVLVSTETTGSPALGGLMVSATLLSGVVAAPFCGRVLDRLGTEQWTPRFMMLGAVGRLALVPAFAIGAPAYVPLAITVLATTVTSGGFGALRTLLGRIVPERLIGSALSLNATSVEFVVISAPFVVIATAMAGPMAPLAAMGVLTAVGAVLLRIPARASAAALEHAGAEAPAPSPAKVTAEPDDAVEGVPQGDAPADGSLWRNRQFIFWLLVTMAFGHLLGTAETGALPIAERLGGGATQAAFLIGILGGASALAGLAYAWLRLRIKVSLTTQAYVLLGLLVAGMLGIALAGTWVMLFVAFLAVGIWTTPLNTVQYEAPGYIVPEKRMTESFSILASAQNVGFALAGALLAVVPLQTMLLLGSATAVLALASAPFLTRTNVKIRSMPAGGAP